MKTKVFTEYGSHLESKVNEWLLKNNKINISFITQSSTECITVLTIFYVDLN